MTLPSLHIWTLANSIFLYWMTSQVQVTTFPTLDIISLIKKCPTIIYIIFTPTLKVLCMIFILKQMLNPLPMKDIRQPNNTKLALLFSKSKTKFYLTSH